ncbi:SDR family NAD(P)-dependent oxidoreductase [Phenylobacterium sp.]|uniref:SDR family NAD(P)-dependent oxidoreductase n=1 Tax=Phenylobacterium sp. TaxID=1871053 RepID=UPI0027337B3A|nr:SDR family NAD(P)-dependent oxidoreductase [Phenylobacterium sp.]MDP3853655.1 SDR family NAD(P)-dependent oxidoreductase [Phenylobacterium sp.]
MTIDLHGHVAIVTGAGGGLGRAHALALARAGAQVVVCDPGGGRDGRSGSIAVAQAVADEIRALGGKAIASATSVTDAVAVNAMVANVLDQWGRIDILVNNAGILRDKTFAKMSLEDFRSVVDVHLMGAVICTKAVWDIMREQNYGRIVMTTSSSGLYGNFGQSNYSAAKLALVGFMNTLRLEGAKYNIHTNCLSPSAATRMTEDIMSPETLAALAPEHVAPAVVALSSQDAPNGIVLCAGAGSFERAFITLTKGEMIGDGDGVAEAVLRRLPAISDRSGELTPAAGPEQAAHELSHAMSHQRRELA